jgi:Asp-tRNA(Asn)/Glu-tRNA(Gln) amidotransferase A subunit family amidase
MVNKLRDCGAIILGKTYMPGYHNRVEVGLAGDEANGTVCRSAYANHNLPSSGGAVAVSAGFAAAATSGDSTAAVIIPASQNACFAIRPSISMGPFFETGSTGIVAKSACDAALLLTALAGPDPSDGYFRDILVKSGNPFERTTSEVERPEYQVFTRMPYATFDGKKLGVVLPEVFSMESWGTHG